MFFSPSTGGFYDAAIHSDLFIEQVDTDLEGVTTDRYMVPDPDGPIADAVEITAKEHAILLEGQSQGKLIVAGKGGKPVLQDPAPPTEAELLRSEILTLESEITDRRYREAILKTDGSWLAKQNAKIEALRDKLRAAA